MDSNDLKMQKTLQQQQIIVPQEEIVNEAAAPLQAVHQVEEVQENLKQQVTQVLPIKVVLPAVLTRTAEPMPEQPIPAEKLTYKQRRERKKLDKKAKKINPYADHTSLNIKEIMDNYRDAHLLKSNLINQVLEEERDQNLVFDGRVMSIFCEAYKVDQQGNPLNDQEAEIMQRNREFIIDYGSCDLQRRLPHLER